MDAIDLTPVVDALHRAERATSAEDGLDAVAVQGLADGLRAAEEAVTALDAERREAGRDPADLARRIEAARIQLERLQTSAAPVAINAADRDELEAAHDAVVDADAKVSATRLGGKAARQDLEKLMSAEQAILDRLGFPTYSSFALAQSAPGPDPETRVELEAARRELAELDGRPRGGDGCRRRRPRAARPRGRARCPAPRRLRAGRVRGRSRPGGHHRTGQPAGGRRPAGQRPVRTAGAPRGLRRRVRRAGPQRRRGHRPRPGVAGGHAGSGGRA